MAASNQLSLNSTDRQALFERLLGNQLRRILALVDPEVRGEVVVADSFAVALRNAEPPPDGAGPAPKYESLLSYSRTEPRLEVIANGLRRALSLGRFWANGAPLAVDGFRLRELGQWSNYRVGSLGDNVGAISSYCNCDCEFCYEKGTRGAGIALGRAQLSRRELGTRVRYYSVDKGAGLLPSSRFSLEPFANPHCLEILERIHAAAPEERVSITTNGACLTEEVVERLSRLRPIMMTVSMNAATVELRNRTMRDRIPDGARIALDSIPRLRQHEIPFLGSYVPWPSKPLSDMEDMVRLLDRYDAVVARICLPSWTKYSHRDDPFDPAEYWAEIVASVERLRQEVAIPIHLMPNMYQLHTMRPVVQGTIKHSPAAQAGFRYGDLIVEIEGERVFTRPEVSRWLAKRYDEPEVTNTRFAVERDGERMEIDIPRPRSLEELSYPYYWLAQPNAPRTWAGALGLHLADGFELTTFVRLKEIAEEYPGKRILLFISELGEPYFHEGMEMLGELGAFVDTVDLYVQRLHPRYWGGNVLIGDLWTVTDLIEQTQSWVQSHGLRPDVVIVPSSFLSHGGRDLVGRCYADFERDLDLELRLLRCRCIAI